MLFVYFLAQPSNQNLHLSYAGKKQEYFRIANYQEVYTPNKFDNVTGKYYNREVVRGAQKRIDERLEKRRPLLILTLMFPLPVQLPVRVGPLMVTTSQPPPPPPPPFQPISPPMPMPPWVSNSTFNSCS